jgi:ABC-type branched-subunit amino acid transport system substrate-binding protein
MLLAVLQIIPESSTDDNVNAGQIVPLAPGQEGTALGEGFTVDEDGNIVGGPSSGGDSSAAVSGGGADSAEATGPTGAGSNVSLGGDGGSAGGIGSGGSAGAKECAAGRNGGKTDTGVDEEKIKLGATVVLDGFAADFLGQVKDAMEAVRKEVNNSGGVCGRQLEVVYKNDLWNPDSGKTAIENLIRDGVFAFAVSPSSEGLNAASNADVFENSGVPVVGADGLNNTQFDDPLIWPVAAATTTTVHVLMKWAWDHGARNPAIVYGNTYRFGVEGAAAFDAQYKALSGKSLKQGGGSGCEQGSRFCGVPADSNYGNQVSAVNQSCNKAPKCDFLLLLLEPASAKRWMSTPGVKRPADYKLAGSGCGGCGMAGAQPLFTRDFAKDCGDKCDGMFVWTGYNPPIEQYAPERNAAVRAYVNALKSENGSADIYNQFTEGGYVGMRLLVHALKLVGPNLTRKALRQTLDNLPQPFDVGLTVPLKWGTAGAGGGARYANHSAQAFKINAKTNFTGFEFVDGPIEDKDRLGMDAG